MVSREKEHKVHMVFATLALTDLSISVLQYIHLVSFMHISLDEEKEDRLSILEVKITSFVN